MVLFAKPLEFRAACLGQFLESYKLACRARAWRVKIVSCRSQGVGAGYVSDLFLGVFETVARGATP